MLTLGTYVLLLIMIAVKMYLLIMMHVVQVVLSLKEQFDSNPNRWISYQEIRSEVKANKHLVRYLLRQFVTDKYITYRPVCSNNSIRKKKIDVETSDFMQVKKFKKVKKTLLIEMVQLPGKDSAPLPA